MEKLNLTPVLNKQRSDREGKYPIRIRSTVKRKVKYYPTNILVTEDQFKNREVVKHPNKNLLNAEIRLKMAEIERDYLEGKLNIKKDSDFYKFCKEKIEQQKKSNSHGTWKHKKGYLSKLKKFRPHLNFSEITSSFMLDFENHCRDLKNKPTTIWSKVKFITTMINAAINDKIIAEDPRGKYTARPYVNPQRPFLTSEEIDRIDHFAVTTNNPTLRKVADWFLFGCYTGLRYSDVKNFDRKKIVNDRIILRTEKKEKDVSIQLHPRLEELLERLQPGVFTNQEVNSYLKHIATICNIDKLITFHISRHTFAVYYLTEGGPIETLSEVLGHSSIKTTKIYGKIINPKVDKDMAKVWGEPSRRSQQNGIKKPK